MRAVEKWVFSYAYMHARPESGGRSRLLLTHQGSRHRRRSAVVGKGYLLLHGNTLAACSLPEELSPRAPNCRIVQLRKAKIPLFLFCKLITRTLGPASAGPFFL